MFKKQLTAQTLKRLRSDGYHCEVVERWIPFPKPGHHKDLFGCIDILAVGRDILGIQATSRPNISARVKKSIQQPGLAEFLAAGGRFQVWGWVKAGSLWDVKIVEVAAADMRPVEVVKPKRRRGNRLVQKYLFDQGESCE